MSFFISAKGRRGSFILVLFITENFSPISLFGCHLAQLAQFLYFFSPFHPLERAVFDFQLGFLADVVVGALYFADDAGLLNPARKAPQDAGIIFIRIFS